MSYIETVRAVQAAGYYTLGLSASTPGDEWDTCDLPVSETVAWPFQHAGILQEVFRQTPLVVGWPSFMVPLLVALQHQHALLVWGGYTRKESLLHPTLEHGLTFAEPPVVCCCHRLQHKCAKEIHSAVIEKAVEGAAGGC